MRPPRPKSLFLPVLGLLLAVLVLLTVVTTTTYFNLTTARQQAQRVLSAQASSIAAGMTAGLRTSWRYWVWHEDALQSLVSDMAQAGDAAFIALMNESGVILADSTPDPAWVPPPVDRIEQNLNGRTSAGWLAPDRQYLYARRLEPDRFFMGPGHMGGRMGGRMMSRMGRGSGFSEEAEKLLPDYILVGLDTTAYASARRRQLIHSLLMAGLLFVMGSTAIYFIFLVQNYRTIDRTLSDLSTYTAGIVDHMPGGLITLNQSGQPVMVNRTARGMFGWEDKTEQELAGHPAIETLSETFGPRLEAGETVLEEECEVTDDQGWPTPLAVSAAPAPAWDQGPAEPGAVFIIRDLRPIRALEERVRQSEKMAAVGRLAAGVAHEVRNPLSSMRGLARFLSRDLDPRSREAEYIKVMIDEIDRLNRVITGLLDYAKPRQPDRKPLKINEIARHTSDLVTDEARRQGISLREDMAPSDPVIMADRDQVVQAMLNVLLNAVEAMPEGGRMTVGTAVEGEEVVFAVEDTGPGFPPSERSKFLDPFFTTKKKGTGLGLAQVAGIMDAHGGRVTLGGQPGMGARVALHFAPASKDGPEA